MSKDLINAVEVQEDPIEIMGKAANVYVASSAMVICAVYLADPNKKGLEEYVEDFIAKITPALKDDILNMVKTLLSDKTRKKSM
jgi:hypothetical protein